MGLVLLGRYYGVDVSNTINLSNNLYGSVKLTVQIKDNEKLIFHNFINIPLGKIDL